jgi:predicted transcriptional regulator
MITPLAPSEQPDPNLEQLVAFFKALADPSRLKILGLLAQQPLTGEQLAEMLNLRASTVSHHLQYLTHEGLVSAQAQSYYNIYRFEAGVLEAMAQRLLAQGTLRGAAADVDVDAYDRKVIANFTTADGRVKTFPAQRKKLEAILRYVLRAFKPGIRYSEKQVNELLAQYNEDTATLRRELVDYGWLKRQGGGREYWIEDLA